MPVETISHSEAQTYAIAGAIARLLKPGDVVFLHGPLGAGKTLFIRAAASELGVTEPVTSPSFTMGQTYQGKVVVHHLDLYRLTGYDREDDADLEPYFDQSAITFIEWPEPIEESMTPDVDIHMEHIDQKSRKITIDSVGHTAAQMEELIAGAGN